MTPRPPLLLDDLLAPIRQAGLLERATGRLDIPIQHLAHDSRRVQKGTCFFALTGATTDGHLFIDKAVHHGASAVVCERPPENPPPALEAVVVVRDARAALAEAAVEFFGRPADRLRLFGVTGTNGKTTVSHLIHDALEHLGEKAGLIGTVQVRLGEIRRDATFTTPDAIAVNELLAEMVEAGCSACAMEVSSHALHQQRVRGLRFGAAVFTNLTHDHLDYHGSLEAYLEAKATLFNDLSEESVAVLNRDDASWERMVAESSARKVTFARQRGEDTGDADVTFRIEENRIEGLRLSIDGRERRFRLAGSFNAYNIVAAYAALVSGGFGEEEVLDALSMATPVPGRLETIRPSVGGGPIVVVDYAHTPDALENVLLTAREMVPAGGALAVVFGCGGDRDRDKRAVMGRLAGDLAQRVILTSDNPRTEDPQRILDDIVRGMAREPEAVVVDRAAAIHEAVQSSHQDDLIVVAGKGHEAYQIIGHERRPFDDRDVVREALDRPQSAET